jgi:hypothetical protein
VRQALDVPLTGRTYAAFPTVEECPHMLRREPSKDPATVPDLELGIAALLLLVVVVLAATLVPNIV